MQMDIRHVSYHNWFLDDFWDAPEKIKNRVETLKRMIEQSHQFPKSMRVHSSAFDEYWIGVVTPDHAAWRVIMELDPDVKRVVFVRLLRHKDMERWL